MLNKSVLFALVQFIGAAVLAIAWAVLAVALVMGAQ